MWWQRLIGKNRSIRTDPSDINIWRLQSLFNNFRRILLLNNAILEDMDHMEQALGGEYIFDKAFLETSVRTIASRVHHVTYNLNALTGNGYISLYDRYQDIRTTLDDILSGNIVALAHSPVLPLHAVGWEMEPLVGIDLVCLAELRHHPESRVAEGFVITSVGTQALTGVKTPPVNTDRAAISKTEVRAEIREQFTILLETQSALQFSVVITRIEGQEDLVQEIGRFSLVPIVPGHGLEIVTESWLVEKPFISAPDFQQKAFLPLPSVDGSSVDLYVRCLEHLICTVCTRYETSGDEPIGPFAVFVRSSSPVIMSGTIQTRSAANGLFEILSITVNLQDSDDAGDTYLLRRTYPFDIIQSTIAPRAAGYRFPEGMLATGATPTRSSFGRGSTLAEIRLLKKLAETAITLERMMGAPVRIRWEYLKEGTWLITGLSPLPVMPDQSSGDDVIHEQQEAEILCQGGQLVQSGIAAGTVVHVTGEMLPADFPAGAVAVARMSSPQLTPLLQRAAAIITENGTTTGHLATVARELRLPALFGVPGALAKLPAGTEVTVDATEITIYRGILEMLLRHGAREMDLSPSDPEYRILRRLLRFIRPLNLVHPESPNFSPQGCRSFHDIIHFCHEKAVDELAHFQERRPGLGAIRTRRMQLGVPMDIQVLDIGGGLTATNGGELTPDATRSEPFSLFLAGLLNPEAWATELPSMGFKDIFSSMPRSMGILSEPVSSLGENLAIISYDYMNISLRLGYHFSVIDAHLGADGSRNYAYFRFAGGLADPERRNRRARFISHVLKAMDFSVSIKGDLVIGRLKMVETPVLRAALSILGALTAFSRQRDTSLYSDADMKMLFTLFADSFLGAFDRGIPSGDNQKDAELFKSAPTDSLRAGTSDADLTGDPQ
jgi:pyruvate, water dikinase